MKMEMRMAIGTGNRTTEEATIPFHAASGLPARQITFPFLAVPCPLWLDHLAPIPDSMTPFLIASPRLVSPCRTTCPSWSRGCRAARTADLGDPRSTCLEVMVMVMATAAAAGGTREKEGRGNQSESQSRAAMTMMPSESASSQSNRMCANWRIRLPSRLSFLTSPLFSDEESRSRPVAR